MPIKKERNKKLFSMVEQGISYKKIANHFEITTIRVKQIYEAQKREIIISEKWPFYSMLSNRTRNCLNNVFGDEAFSNPKIIFEYGRKNVARIKNIGRFSLKEIDKAFILMGIIQEGQKW